MRVRWCEEEIKLLLSYYRQMQSGDMHKKHPLVIEASERLRKLPFNAEFSDKSDKFRNPNGVALKLANFLFIDPRYKGKGMKGCSGLDKKVFNEFYGNGLIEKQSVKTYEQVDSFRNLIKLFVDLISEMGAKGQPMGEKNRFNRLAQELEINYAGSKLLQAKSKYLDTSPVISYGLGRFSAVPWIVFTAHDQELMNGIYPSLLFFLEEQTAVLSYGVSETNSPNVNWSKSYLKGSKTISQVFENPEKYGNSYVKNTYQLSDLLDSSKLTEISKDLMDLIHNFHDQFDVNNVDLSKEVINLKPQPMQYPSAFQNWFSSNIGGVRLPMNTNTGRPLGQEIIEGKIHYLIREMISDFKNKKGKFLCVLVGGPGNGKTDLMEFASEVFFNEFGIPIDHGVRELQKAFKKSNRKAKFEEADVILNLIQDASQRDESSDSPINSLFNDLEEFHQSENVLTLICVNRGVLENTVSKSKDRNEAIHKYHEILKRIHSFNNLQAVINDWKIWGDVVSEISLYTWSMDFDTLFKDNETEDNNLIRQIIEKSKSNVNFRKGSPLSPSSGVKHFINSTSCVFNLSRVLRYSEILNGKRFTYRELFSLLAYLFHHSDKDCEKYEDISKEFEAITDHDVIGKFVLLFPLYQRGVSFRFFNYFIEPKEELIVKCLRPYKELKQKQLKLFFDSLSKTKFNDTEIPGFVSSNGSRLFDPIYFDDNNFEIRDDSGGIFNLKSIIDKVIYNQNLNCKYFTNILGPIEIELIESLELIKDIYCLSVDYDDFNATQLNGVDLLKTYINNLIISIFKRSLFFSSYYIRERELVEEYLSFVQNDSSAFIEILQDSLTSQNKIENSLSTSIGQTSEELKNNVIEKSNIVPIESLPKPVNIMPSSDQIILTYTVRGQNSNEVIVITYGLFKSIKKSEKQVFSACLDKNYLMWQEIKKIELSIRSNLNGGELYIPDLGGKRIRLSRNPLKINII
jgi:hypothetical protein